MYPVIDNPGQYKAAIYARLSKEDDNKAGDDSESIKNQIALIQDYAEHTLTMASQELHRKDLILNV